MENVDEKTLCALQEDGYIESNTEEFIKIDTQSKVFLSKLRQECCKIE